MYVYKRINFMRKVKKIYLSRKVKTVIFTGNDGCLEEKKIVRRKWYIVSFTSKLHTCWYSCKFFSNCFITLFSPFSIFHNNKKIIHICHHEFVLILFCYLLLNKTIVILTLVFFVILSSHTTELSVIITFLLLFTHINSIFIQLLLVYPQYYFIC